MTRLPVFPASGRIRFAGMPDGYVTVRMYSVNLPCSQQALLFR